MTSIWMSILLWLLTIPAQAELWTGVLSNDRAIDWSTAGAAGEPQTRSTICSTLTSSATAAQINSAIAACPSGQVVYLEAGTYSLNDGLIFNDKSNVTLRGAGPTQTILTFTSRQSCGGLFASVCVANGQLNWTGSPTNTANWTAGYTKGATEVTLSSVTNLQVGSLLILDQLDDSSTDTGELWICVTVNICSNEGNANQTRGNNRHQTQVTRVTAINGSVVTISPGLYMPNWRSGQSPGAWWSTDTPVIGVGIENLKMDHTSNSGTYGTAFYNAYGCWMKNVVSVFASRAHVRMYQSNSLVIRDSYFFGVLGSGSLSYGLEPFHSSQMLIENNIFQHIAVPMMMSTATTGNVWGYNFAIDDYFTAPSSWMLGSSFHHAGGILYNLLEGNDGIGFTADQIHGTSNLTTVFRNFFTGWETGKTAQTVAVHIYANNRYFNIIGNILGTNATHNLYENYPAIGATNCNTSIFSLGWGGNCGNHASIVNDALVRNTLMRWGNYDTVNDATRWESSEVPSGISPYPNSVPASQVLPDSFYRSARPEAWWRTPAGVPAWPAIGPDVTNATGPGSHAARIPAKVCFEDVMLGDGTETTALSFDATTCYSSVGITNFRMTGGVSLSGAAVLK